MIEKGKTLSCNMKMVGNGKINISKFILSVSYITISDRRHPAAASAVPKKKVIVDGRSVIFGNEFLKGDLLIILSEI